MQRRAWRWACGLVLAGCPAENRDAAQDSTGVDATGTSTIAATTTASTATSEDMAGESSTTVGETPSSSSGEAPQACGLEDLAPGAANPLVASDRVPMQLPLEIADILARSCGCHLADDLVIPGDYPSQGTLDLTSWPAWHADYGAVPTYEAARQRLDPEVPVLVMPPAVCDVGEGATMLPEDRARLLEWIAALAPDGVTWSHE